MFRSRFPLGLIRQSWTKSYRTVSVKDVEALKKLTFHSVHARNNISPPGLPLSSAQLNVSKVLINMERRQRQRERKKQLVS